MSVWSKNKQLLVFFPSVNHDLFQLQKLSTLILWLSVYASVSITADLRESALREEYLIFNYIFASSVLSGKNISDISQRRHNAMIENPFILICEGELSQF